MTAVAEPKTEPYVMPTVRVGDEVEFYLRDNRTKPRRAVVREVWQEKIELKDTEGGASPIYICFHVDHPAIVNKLVDVSHDGTWDFRRKDREMNAWKAQVECDLIALSKRLETIEAGRKPKTTE